MVVEETAKQGTNASAKKKKTAKVDLFTLKNVSAFDEADKVAEGVNWSEDEESQSGNEN